jgi:hypothetical protein
MIEAGEVGAGRTLVGAAEAGRRAQRLLPVEVIQAPGLTNWHYRHDAVASAQLQRRFCG